LRGSGRALKGGHDHISPNRGGGRTVVTRGMKKNSLDQRAKPEMKIKGGSMSDRFI